VGEKPVRRHMLSKRDARIILREAKERLPGFTLETQNIELVEYEGFTIYRIKGEPALIRLNDKIIPHVKWLLKHGVGGLPYVKVDQGATRAIGRGANNLMVPGITGVQGHFNEGDVVVIVDERYNTPIAVGIALMGSSELRDKLSGERRGKAIRILHRPGDRIWRST